MTEAKATYSSKRNDEIREAALDKREQAVKGLEEQVRKMGDDLDADAKRKVATRAAELDQREAELSPRIAAVDGREQAAEERERNLSKRDQDCHILEVSQNEFAGRQEELRETLLQRERAVNEREITHVRLQKADEDSVEVLRKQLTEDIELREKRLLESKASVESMRESILSEHKASAERSRRADELLQVAEGREKQSIADEKVLKARYVDRDKKLSHREALVAAQETEAEKVKIELVELETVTNAKADEQENLSKGLNKAKLDNEVAQNEIDRRQRLVRAILKKHGLNAELKQLE